MAWNALGNWLSRLNPLNWEREFTEYFAADDLEFSKRYAEKLRAAVDSMPAPPEMPQRKT